MKAAMDIDRIREWTRSAKRTALSDAAALEAWHILGAQCRFVKSLPPEAAVLDVGAGDGSLQVYRSWPPPPRPDLTMFAFAIDQGIMFDRYDRYELGTWPDARPDFGGRRFDAIFAANFIEHIDQPTEFIRWAANRLTTRGRVYLEWPRPEALTLPTAGELHAIGLDVMTGNYFDDATHCETAPSALRNRAQHGSGA
jgi:2-polyprenyl-3-methyl-5-hydroxy-6-metoxy-1,4-benzoquinol methylase